MNTIDTGQQTKTSVKTGLLIIGLLAAASAAGFLWFSTRPQSTTTKFQRPTVESLTTSLKQKTLAFSTISSTLQPPAALELKALAQQRKPLMAALPGTHPGRFAQLSLTDEEFQQLPADVQGLVERRVRVTGKLNILHEDFFDENRSTDTLSLEIDGVSHPLYPTSPLPDNAMSGSTLEVSGLQLDDALLAVGPTDQGKTAESGITVLDTSSVTAVMGDQRTLVILVRPTSVPASPDTASTIEQEMFSATDSVNQFFQKNSYGSVSLSGTVRGWYALNVPSNTCSSAYAQPALNAVNASEPALALDSYQHLVILYPNYCTPIGAFATMSLSSSYGTHIYKVATATLWGSFSVNVKRTVAHEFGHAFGNSHASYFNCYGITDGNGAPVSIDARCDFQEYNDPFDTMGNIHYAHFNAYHKIAPGWLGSANLRTVIPSDMGTEGYADFPIEPIELDSSPGVPGTTGIKAIRIQRGPDDYLYVEYRQPLDFDAGLIVRNPNNVYDGALLNIQKTWLIDASPDATVTDGNFKPTLPLSVSPCTANPTQAFIDPATLAKIKVCGKTPSLLTVRVWLTPDTTPPTVTVTYPQQNEYFYQSLSISGQATDNTYVSRVDFYLDNAQTPTVATTNPSLFPTIPISSLSDGQHTVIVKAVDGSGNVSASATISFRVDNTLPSVTVVQPQPNTTVSGVYQIQVNAQDSQGLQKVEVQLDNNQFQPLFVNMVSCLTVQPCPLYVFNWNTYTTTNQPHTLRVSARNMAGVNTWSAIIPVSVNNAGSGGGGRGIDPIETQ